MNTRRDRLRGQRGFSILEMVITMAVGALILGGSIEAMGGADSLVKDGRARLRAKSEHRRNLVSLTNTLRQADLRELGGFGADGTATMPVIKRVSGADLDGRTFEESEVIRWVAKTRAVQGVEHPGELRAETTSGASRLIADRVPKGSFKCRQMGSVIVVDLSTYYRTREGRTLTMSGSSVVQLRNQE